MSNRFDDSKNHVPEVSSRDEWENPPAGNPSDLHTIGENGIVLPSPRVKHEFSAFRNHSLDSPGAGLYIAPPSYITGEATVVLNDKKLKSPVVRLENTVFRHFKGPRQSILKPLTQSRSATSPRKGEEQKWGSATKRSIRWIISSGIGITLLVVFALMMLPTINETNAARPSASQIGLVIDPAEHISNIESLNEWLARRSEAMQLFRAFATSSSVEDVRPLIREPVTNLELVKKNIQKKSASDDWSPPQSSSWIAFEAGDQICGVLEGTLPDFSKFRAYMIDSENHLVLDWKATTGHGSATFDELAAGQGDPGEIRAFISSSGYYNHIFTEADYQSYQLISPDETKSIWCYTRRGQTADAQFKKIFFEGDIIKPEKLAYRVTVRLARGQDDTLPNQWILDELLHHEWVNP